jgi:hypothetical protein
LIILFSGGDGLSPNYKAKLIFHWHLVCSREIFGSWAVALFDFMLLSSVSGRVNRLKWKHDISFFLSSYNISVGIWRLDAGRDGTMLGICWHEL